MELSEIFFVLSAALLKIGIVGTGITICIFFITVIFNVKVMKRAVLLLSSMFILIWLLQIGFTTYLLFEDDSKKTVVLNSNSINNTRIFHNKRTEIYLG